MDVLRLDLSDETETYKYIYFGRNLIWDVHIYESCLQDRLPAELRRLPIVGQTYRPGICQAVLERAEFGDLVYVVPEYDNPHDSNAHKVYLYEFKHPRHVGYVPRDLAARLRSWAKMHGREHCILVGQMTFDNYAHLPEIELGTVLSQHALKL